MTNDSRLGFAAAADNQREHFLLNSGVNLLQSGHEPALICRNNLNGAEGSRTPDLSIANAALSQLSYRPDLA